MAKFATSQQIAELLNVKEYDVKKFVKAGMPKEGQNKYNPAECVHWYIKFLQDKADFGTVEEIALMIDMSPRWVQKLAAEKNFPKVEHGKYNKIAFLHRYLEMKEDEIKLAKQGGQAAVSSKDKLLDAKAAREQLKLEADLKRYVPLDLVQNHWITIITMFSKSLDALPVKVINKLLVCRKKEEMMDVLKKATEQLKNVLYQSNIEAKISDTGGDS